MRALHISREDPNIGGEGGSCPKCRIGGAHGIAPIGHLANDPDMVVGRMECGSYDCDNEWWDLIPQQRTMDQ